MLDKIIFFLSMIFVFYISVSSIQNYRINFEALEEITKQFKTGFIEDVRLVRNATQCPENYTSIVQLGYNWPGNYKGCGCKGENSQFKFNKGSCPVLKDCHKVEETQEIPLNKWRNNLVCYKRSNKNYETLNLVSYQDADECTNSTHRVCGAIDGLNNLLCMAKNETCPVTEIKFYTNVTILNSSLINDNSNLNNTSQVSNNTLTNSSSINNNTIIANSSNDNKTIINNQTNGTATNNTIISLNNTLNKNRFLQSEVLSQQVSNTTFNTSTTKRFVMSSETSSSSSNNTRIFTETKLMLQISHQEFNQENLGNNSIKLFFRTGTTLPCFNPRRNPSSENYFALMKNKFDLMCDKNETGQEILDSSYSLIDQYNLDNYYKENSLNVHYLIDQFNIDISNTNIKLYGKSYAGWNLDCRLEYQDSLESFFKLSSDLNHVFISIILHSLICISVIISIGVIAFYVTNYFELIFKAINIGFVIFNIIFAIQIISNSNWVINIATDENGYLCGDVNLNYLLLEISSAASSLQYSFIIILVASVLTCIIFIYVIYLMIKPAAREVQEKLIQMR